MDELRGLITKRLFTGALLSCLVFSAARPASAVLAAVDSAEALREAESGSWLLAGSSTLPNSFSLTTAEGIGMVVDNTGPGSFAHVTQGGSWKGNFAPGESVLLAPDSAAPISITFDQAIAGFGAQLQPVFYGSFTGVIEAFDNVGLSLGQFRFEGVSNGAADDSALFAGIASSTPNIWSVALSVDRPGWDGFGVGDFTVTQTVSIRAVPNPEISSAAVGLAVFAAAGARRRRRTAANRR